MQTKGTFLWNREQISSYRMPLPNVGVGGCTSCQTRRLPLQGKRSSPDPLRHERGSASSLTPIGPHQESPCLGGLGRVGVPEP